MITRTSRRSLPALGFDDQAHLTRSLKPLVGQTPGAIARAAAAAKGEGGAPES